MEALKIALVGLSLVAVAISSELGPPFNQPWEGLRIDERVIVAEGSPPSVDDRPGKATDHLIDGITGYKSVQFGDPIEKLAPRLRRKRLGNVVSPLEPDGAYVLRALYRGEETYGGFPVGITVKFLDGRVISLDIAFLAPGAQAFEIAFKEKYGPPNAGDNYWRGESTEYRIDHGARGGIWVKMKSLKVEREIQGAREASRKKLDVERQDAAKKLKRDF